MNIFLFLGALNGFLSVALGAFGAHVLEGKIEPKYLETWQTGVTYQMFHAGALLVVGILSNKISASLLSWSGWLFFIGIILFSGSLFLLSLTGIRVLGAITPFGGVSFLIAWVLLMIVSTKYF
ncbi:hypothetical protein B4064_2403 [Caldibacillus thermoamylovorans]|uniref:DUF423 domain-containing protein n=1 Tax=Caldibacillus thermoamylovorans TaxID=35841 RepID=UPI0005A43A09|nr:DUF423 domain-containing protein [Caldibacillus thermoamylovorans]KIO63311.1 hypothetical protein B4065_2979 [Caldibacillus thermoamylovorans]KIO65910.1 hypothetical protein B4064_2403 [Caldibacillus thermoamylovorans]